MAEIGELLGLAWRPVVTRPMTITDENGHPHPVDYAAEKERLAALGYPPFLSSQPSLLISRGPGNVLLEPCDLRRDQPYLRDLYPADSPTLPPEPA
jgi:hypothetical protein